MSEKFREKPGAENNGIEIDENRLRDLSAQVRNLVESGTTRDQAVDTVLEDQPDMKGFGPKAFPLKMMYKSRLLPKKKYNSESKITCDPKPKPIGNDLDVRNGAAHNEFKQSPGTSHD